MALSAAALAACGGGSGKPVLTWYINPDPAQYDADGNPVGQTWLASQCGTDQYDVQVQLLPQQATQQRVQLERRLAAHDSSIDLMSLDPPFTAEFADAGFLAPIPETDAQALSSGVLAGALEGATWDGKLVVVPLWANTQLLWFRKSVAEKAGLDMTQPVTWDQIIDAAEQTGSTVEVQADKYEGYVVWINALIQGAGGDIVSDTTAGPDAKIDINSPAGKDAATIISKLANSSAADPQFSTSNEGTAYNGLLLPNGGFEVNWTFVYSTANGGVTGGTVTKDTFDDIGWTTYPETVAGEPAKPPIGGINIGISAYSSHPDFALEAAKCITTAEHQVKYAEDTGNMPSNEAAYDNADLQKAYPMLDLFKQSINDAGPRPLSGYWSYIVGAILAKWHPGNSVNPDTTPAASADFISQVLAGKALL